MTEKQTPDFEPQPRKENLREQRRTIHPVHFDLIQIKAHFDESFDAIIRQTDIAERLINEDDLRKYADILRMQIVFLEAILDFYIHEISKYALYQMFIGNWDRSERYANIMIPMRDVEKAIIAPESKEWFFEYINGTMGKEVFLSAESMKDQLNEDGIPFTAVMHRAFACETQNESFAAGRKFIRELFNRRNMIVHQDDRSHESAEQHLITRDYVERCCNNVKSIVNAIQEIAEEKG